MLELVFFLCMILYVMNILSWCKYTRKHPARCKTTIIGGNLMKEETKKSLENFASFAKHLAVFTIALIDFIGACKSLQRKDESNDE